MPCLLVSSQQAHAISAARANAAQIRGTTMVKIFRLMQIVTLAVALQAQAPPALSPAMEQANKVFFGKDWEAAAKAFESITHSEPGNALAWMRLGVARHKLQHFAGAVEAYKHAENDAQIGPSALYREAATLARMNNRDEAVAALEKAVDAWLAQPQVFQQDADLASLHDDAAYRKVIEK